LAWYERFGRHTLPWRVDHTPYRVLVSEFMLQQTQVDRVLPLFNAFVKRWPDFAALANASRADVVRAWQGLGYNSRAIRLHASAQEVVTNFGGELPRKVENLSGLPGVGPYTLRAIRAFAFEDDEVAVDTNVRRIVHRVVAGIEWPPKLSAQEIDTAAIEMLPRGRAFAWNSALMDLGSTICTARAPKCLVCPLRENCAAAPIDAAVLEQHARRHSPVRGPQSTLPFERTRRYLRGRIVDRLRELEHPETLTLEDLHAELPGPDRTRAELAAVVEDLVRDGLLERVRNRFRLA
jgi:A/G-specific adenine glycosylase